MRHLNIIWILLLLMTHFMLFGQRGAIKGQVYDRREEKGLYLAFVKLANTEICYVTDENGNFILDSIPFGTYNVTVQEGYYIDTTLKALKITSDSVLIIRLEFPLKCDYIEHKNNDTCPICGKNDQVIPIVYGLPLGKLDYEKYYYAGCQIPICYPYWYCKREKLKF